MANFFSKLFGINKIKGRSKIVAKNASISLLFKGLSILIGFIFVPLYLNSVGQRQYGIILTITSISNFISFFDVGIGNGLRTKLGKAISNGEKHLGRQYVSTSYFYVTLLFTGVFLLYCIAGHWLTWSKILNIPANEVQHLDRWIFLVIALFSVRFIFQLIGSVLMADQKSAINDSIQFSTSLVTLIACLILKSLHSLNFYTLLITMCALPVVVLIMYSIIFFRTKYRWLAPSLAYVDHKIRKDLLSLGFKFFIIQLVSLIIFSTTNILIAQLFSIGDVTTYNIAFKYYNITVMVFAILMSPLWGAFTNAWYQSDVKWISKNIKYYILISFAFLFVNIFQFFVYPTFIRLWLKQDMAIPLLLTISFILYNFIYCYNNIFSHFLASIGQVNRQVYAAVFGGVINIPVTIFLARHTPLGLSSILYANIICLLPSSLVTTIQAIQLIRSKSKKEIIDGALYNVV